MAVSKSPCLTFDNEILVKLKISSLKNLLAVCQWTVNQQFSFFRLLCDHNGLQNTERF